MNHPRPGTSPTRLDEAIALSEQGRLADAEATLRPVLAADPHNVEALHHLGLVLASTKRLSEAEQAWTKALQLRPDATDVLYNLALLHQMAQRHDAAIECYQKLLALQPGSSEVLLNLGNAYLALQRVDEAIEAYREAVRLDAGSAIAFNNLGMALGMAKRPDDAAAAYANAIRVAPEAADPLVNLAQLKLAAGRLAGPANLLQRAVHLQPRFIAARRALAQLHELTGNVEAAIQERRQVLASDPDRADLHRELILSLNFADGDAGDTVADACRNWHRRFAAPLTPAQPRAALNRDPERRLRVGYVGGTQFRTHTLAHTMLPLVEAHSDAVELYCYSDLHPDQEDDISARFQRRTTWRRTAELSDDEYAQAIAADRIDVLVDPLGFVGGSRLLALARRPAPIQVSFPVMGTCGGATMDYVLCDDQILPPAAERHYAERRLRIPFAYCYRPLGTPPAVAPSPALTRGTVTFGSMNSLPKISRRAIRAWRRILDQAADSRLLVKAGFPFRDPDVRRLFLRRLEDEGVEVARVVLKDWVPTHGDHLAAYGDIDIALDSFPYNGVVTTYEALLMGVPVVTRTGPRVLDRYATSILRTVDFEEGIAADDDGYVARAVALASDRRRLAELRASLRTMLLSSPACDGTFVARSIEAALRTAWRSYCAASH